MQTILITDDQIICKGGMLETRPGKIVSLSKNNIILKLPKPNRPISWKDRNMVGIAANRLAKLVTLNIPIVGGTKAINAIEVSVNGTPIEYWAKGYGLVFSWGNIRRGFDSRFTVSKYYDVEKKEREDREKREREEREAKEKREREERIRKERADSLSLMAFFQPYYQLDKDIEKNAIAKLKENYHTNLKGILPSIDYLRYIERTLKEIYQAGIVSTENIQQLQKDSTSSVMVIDDKLANPQATENIYTVKKAYEHLLTADSTHFNREVLRQCALNEYITPNLTFDEERTQAAKEEILNNYSWANGLVVSGQKIIDRGEIVSPHTYNILESLRKESIKRNESMGQNRLILGGQVLFVGMLMLCFMLYLDLFRKDYYQRKGSLSLLFTLIVFYSVITAFMVTHNIFNVYIIPYAMLPIIIRVFLDSRTAFLTHVITILICSISLRFPHEFILTQLAAGLVAIFSLRELSQRSQLFRTALLVILTYAAIYFAFELMTENGLSTDFSKLNIRMYTYFIINGILLLFTYPLLFLLEKTFGFTSNVTLVELSNINNDLLRQMSETVPGTFQHSMQVANLAAEAAIRIGAKSQLVRTGALYHDIGKMENPAFFTENQSGGVNPHKNLNYEQSAQVVISHVTDGLKLADKHNLPKAVKDFISIKNSNF